MSEQTDRELQERTPQQKIQDAEAQAAYDSNPDLQAMLAKAMNSQTVSRPRRTRRTWPEVKAEANLPTVSTVQDPTAPGR